MPSNDIVALEQVSVQSEDVTQNEEYGSSFGFLNWVARAGETVSPWWSAKRDKDLRAFFPGSDHLAGAIYAIQARMTTVPFMILARDNTIERHVQMAKYITTNMYEMTNFGQGWNMGYGKFITDYLTQDNGAFMEVLGPGPKDGPIVGLPMGLNHLDSALCMRTRNPEYPVVYTDLNSKRYKLHHTRVIDMVSLPSADIQMNSVGLCGVSRAINTAQHLVDIGIFEQEKLGSRPTRSLLIGSKVSTRDLGGAFKAAERQMDNEGLNRFAKTVFIGNPNQDINVDMLDLASLPDGYDKSTSIQLGMACIALAFGVDLRELWPATITGATKADASIQHMKARGKAIGEILQMTVRQMSQKFLPPYLEMVHDFTDDDEDAARANILGTRAEAYTKLIDMEAINQRTVREKMLADRSVTKVQFHMMELESGRLPNGEPLLSLFYSLDPETKEMLALPIKDPLKGSIALVPAIDEQLIVVNTIYINTSSERLKRKAASALFALNKLRTLWAEEPHPIFGEQEAAERQEMEMEVEREGAIAEATNVTPAVDSSSSNEV